MTPTKMEVDDATKQCFSPIQNRKLPSLPSSCSLCPSMDLIVVAIGDALWIHRTVSWQRLATWKQENERDVTTVCWSPDGSSLAVALDDGEIALHHVEALSSEEEEGQVHTIALPQTTTVVSLKWAHVGRPHPSWILSEDEMEREATWNYQKCYLDRASTFLPPSSYHIQAEGAPSSSSSAASAATKTRPSCQTPLSLLCAASNDGKIHLYLHGRYPVATLDSPTIPDEMVCTSDLTHLIVKTDGDARITLHHLPALAQHRYSLQVVSALYCSMTSHLQAMELSLKEVGAAWKSSLKPLDLKLDLLRKNLTNYGVEADVRTVLRRYILEGSTSQDGSVVNALDQFFANVQMNDQLLQRLERSLHSAVANVETLARRNLLSPAKSLAYDVGEMQIDLLEGNDARESLQRASQALVLGMQDLVSNLVEARFRLRDLVSWLRSAGSQNKARETPPKSVQRENAKKRRVTQAVVERVAGYLELDLVDGGLTEGLIGIPITDFFRQDRNYMVTPRPTSPKCLDIVMAHPIGSRLKRPTIPFAVKQARETMDTFFEKPRAFVSESVTQTDIALSPASSSSEKSVPCAIHTRIGRDRVNNDDIEATNEEFGNFFSPRLASGDESSFGCCRHWSIVARAASFNGDNDCIALFTIPLGWNDEKTVPFYLGARLVLPFSYRVEEIVFYGDDGNSSLSAGTDSGTGKEGRQSIGFLVSKTDEDTSFCSEELWMVRYDYIIFQPVALSPGTASVLNDQLIADESTINVQALQENQDEDMEHDNNRVVYAKTRRMALKQTESPSQLLLSGSRGVGGVLMTAPSHVELDLFDLEEDEEASDDEDE